MIYICLGIWWYNERSPNGSALRLVCVSYLSLLRGGQGGVGGVSSDEDSEGRSWGDLSTNASHCPPKYSLLQLGTKCSPRGQIFHGLQITQIIVDCHGQGGSNHLVRCRSAPCLRSAWCCWASYSSSAPTWDQHHHHRRHQAQKPLKRTRSHRLKAQNHKKENQPKTWKTNL